MTILEDIYSIINNNKPSTETVIWNQPNNPKNRRPELPYISINFKSLTQRGTQELLAVEGDKTTYRDCYELIMNIQYFSSQYDSVFQAEVLRANLEIDREYELSLDTDISYRRSSSVINVSELIDAGFENRASLDVFFDVNIDKEKSPEFIDKITAISGTVNESEYYFDDVNVV